VQGDKRLQYKPKKIDEIKKIIEDEYRNGVEAIVFTGGEPTVHPNLVEAVKHAHDTGYISIQIQSNGRNFSNESYVQSLIDAWVTEFSPSIHGFHKETHDMLVGSPWAWEEVIKWIIVLKSLHQYILINSVITQANYKEIPLLAKLLITMWVPHFQFAYVHILWSAAKNKESIPPRKSEIMPYVHKALDIARTHHVRAFTEAIPYCFMQGYEYAISENVIPETAIIDAECRTDSYEDYRINEGKVKHEKCKTCIKDSVCEWPWKEYPEIYGWDEFIPITQ
jgi:MoaA/NifB/PqqE/SkfB family radical SAM enzyme